MMDYEIVVGLEVHVRLNTDSKIFCGDKNDFGRKANESISAVSLAHPGTLPVVNNSAIDSGILLGLAINGNINKFTSFDRKHYFYPDLSKAYQITQDSKPISVGGYLEWESEHSQRRIRFHHIHLEEDAGKSMHDQSDSSSLIDYNRAGVPLIEMVTEPDFRSGQEVYEFLAELQRLLRYLGISNADMEKGSMRCDCNVSIREKGSDVLNERCEIKNVNSKRFAKAGVEAEAKRQMALLEKGTPLKRSTLKYDTEKNITYPIREKESVSDYRYFPDPDLPTIHITNERIEDIKKRMPLLPNASFSKLMERYGLTDYQAKLIYAEKACFDYFESLSSNNLNSALANFIINHILPYCNQKNIALSEYPLPKSAIHDYLDLIESNKVSSTEATQTLLPELLNNPAKSVQVLSEELDIFQSDDQDTISEIAKQIIDNHPDKVQAYRNGKKGLIGFFMGQAMRLSTQKIDPNKLKQEISKRLNNS